MKTNVIQLEVHDDVISIKDKMAWQSCQRMILVWPKRGKILHNELELVLLNREAKSLGAELALVTHHPVVCEWALDSNLPLFASISAADKGIWKLESKGSFKNRVPKGVEAIIAKRENLPHQPASKKASPFLSYSAIIISLLAVIAIFVVVFPQAEVTYFPVTTLQEIEVRIKASEVFSGINPSGNIPEKAIFIEVNGEKSISSSGKAMIPTTKAVGEVVFTNLTNSAVTLPTGTLLLGGNGPFTSFTLVKEVVLTAGAHDTATGQVEALVAGTEGNLPPDSLWTLSGGMDALVSVVNPDAFSNGAGLETPSPSEEDYTLLERQLLADLMNQGLASLRAGQNKGVGLIEPSLIMEQILLSEQVNKIGDPADEALLRMNVRLKINAYQQSDINAIAGLVLTSNQPSGYKPLNEDISIARVGDFQVDDFGQAIWTIKTSRTLVPDWNIETTAVTITGMKVANVQSTLSDLFAQSSPVMIKLWLDKWPWMPFLSTNIHFVDGVSS